MSKFLLTFSEKEAEPTYTRSQEVGAGPRARPRNEERSRFVLIFSEKEAEPPCTRSQPEAGNEEFVLGHCGSLNGTTYNNP
jgi:hypothetical protein